jgi:hypothetical protein
MDSFVTCPTGAEPIFRNWSFTANLAPWQFQVKWIGLASSRDHHNETIGILICGTKNDRSFRYSLGRSTSPMAVAAYTP